MGIPQKFEALGFVSNPVGTHGCRSITLEEVRTLFFIIQPATGYPDIQRLIIDENILGKRTIASRKVSARRLREFYGLDPTLHVYSALRLLWDNDPEEQPMLSILCASARDPVLRESSSIVLPWPEGENLPKVKLEQTLKAVYPGRYSDSAIESIVRRLLSSWTQSGHLSGRTRKSRVRAFSGPSSVAYALYLSYLTGARGQALFESAWMEYLDLSSDMIHAFAFDASKRGWIDYRNAGGIVDVGFNCIIQGSSTEGR